MNQFIMKVATIILLIVSTAIQAGQTGEFFRMGQNGFDIVINTVPTSRTYAQAGIRINSAGYTLNNAGIDCFQADNGFCIFSVSDTMSKFLTVTGPISNYEVTLCLDGVNQFTCQKYVNASLSANKFAYVNNYTTGNVSMCQLDDDENLMNCITATTLTSGIISTHVNRPNKRIFFTSPFTGAVTSCQINSTTGALSNCTTQYPGLGLVVDLKTNITSNKAYLTNTVGELYSCNLNATTGALSSCVLETSIGTSGTGLALTNSRIYIAGSTQVVKCDLNNNTGHVSNCTQALTGLSSTGSIAFDNTRTHAYLGQNCGLGTITVCQVNPQSGNLINCMETGESFGCPYGVFLSNSNLIAYVIDYTLNSVQACSILPETGLLDGCSDTGNDFLNPVSGDLY